MPGITARKQSERVHLSEVQRYIPVMSPHFHSVGEDGGTGVLSRKPDLCGFCLEPGVNQQMEAPWLAHSSQTGTGLIFRRLTFFGRAPPTSEEEKKDSEEDDGH